MLIEADVDTCARHITSIATLNASEKVDILMRVCYFCLLSDLLHFESDFCKASSPFIAAHFLFKHNAVLAHASHVQCMIIHNTYMYIFMAMRRRHWLKKKNGDH